MITMKDIAKAAGVSRSTVSFVLNGREKELKIAEATCLKIKSTAAELGYHVNDIAKSVRTGKTKVLAFLTPLIDMEYDARILSGFINQSNKLGYFVKPFEIEDRDFEKQLGNAIKQRVDGVVYRNNDIDLFRKIKKELDIRKIPFAVVESRLIEEADISVYSDEFGGIFKALRHLVDLGHTRIGFISGIHDKAGYSILRYRAFLAAMKKLNLPIDPEIILSAQPKERVLPQYSRMAEEILKRRGSQITAVFCASDIIAMIVLQHAYKMKIWIPDELSVVGYANLYSSSFTAPALTTVEQKFSEMGNAAAKLLVERIEKSAPARGKLRKEIGSELIIRDSTCINK